MPDAYNQESGFRRKESIMEIIFQMIKHDPSEGTCFTYPAFERIISDNIPQKDDFIVLKGKVYTVEYLIWSNDCKRVEIVIKRSGLRLPRSI